MGRALRWLREKEGRRQYETARAAGVTKAMLSAYETGKQSPSLASLEKILDALRVDLLALARALDHVNERPPRPVETAPAGSLAGRGEAAGAPDVRAILGVAEMVGEEEEALGRMLDGFHRLLRYLHRSAAKGEEPAGEA
ncbi:MAG TPA: helix-turn-helix transcriptional regulator [Thermoanaerobaculia bacterium]|nr:helix-turn-helix transcriptional regulator [Thermoanaerobaculia bacterium]